MPTKVVLAEDSYLMREGAATPARLGVVAAADIDPEALVEVAVGHWREES